MEQPLNLANRTVQTLVQTSAGTAIPYKLGFVVSFSDAGFVLSLPLASRASPQTRPIPPRRNGGNITGIYSGAAGEDPTWLTTPYGSDSRSHLDNTRARAQSTTPFHRNWLSAKDPVRESLGALLRPTIRRTGSMPRPTQAYPPTRRGHEVDCL